MEEQASERLTRKQKRILKQLGHKDQTKPLQDKLNFELKKIEPLTENQRRTFESFRQGQHLLLHGIAGTGKSFISLYLALQYLLENKDKGPIEKVVICRSVVPTRDMGFLPGSSKDKQKVYESPYNQIFQELFGRGDAYDYLKRKGVVEFMTTSFIRGITLNNCILCCDEIQNMSGHELDSVITRMGTDTRLIFSGDITQSDFLHDHDRGGLRKFMDILNKMNMFEFIEFDEHDIVRSELVKSYIIEKKKLGYSF
jgi:phosphate starvation-inducible protein PhoH